ncbi:MAG TPA: imidazole glycerol phosphate synthase subunit HisH [Gammaproteobacteria bacterium]|nr:imidazole glycerol phosphate synthase subunit HisH [Gammaproteobacteria bacterium]
MRQSVAVIDYGSGNLHSVAKAVEHAGSNQVVVTSDAATIAAADRVILPGVGAMGDCMRGLQERGLDSVVLGLIGKKPLMAVCVGMQILTEFGEESSGIHALGVFQGHITQFPRAMTGRAGVPLKVPHMGWNQVVQSVDHPLWHNIDNESRFYFVHSYYVPAEHQFMVGSAQYGKSIAAALSRDSIFAVQFHPEKSQHAGLQLLKNFANWSGK